MDIIDENEARDLGRYLSYIPEEFEMVPQINMWMISSEAVKELALEAKKMKSRGRLYRLSKLPIFFYEYLFKKQSLAYTLSAGYNYNPLRFFYKISNHDYDFIMSLSCYKPNMDERHVAVARSYDVANNDGPILGAVGFNCLDNQREFPRVLWRMFGSYLRIVSYLPRITEDDDGYCSSPSLEIYNKFKRNQLCSPVLFLFDMLASRQEKIKAKSGRDIVNSLSKILGFTCDSELKTNSNEICDCSYSDKMYDSIAFYVKHKIYTNGLFSDTKIELSEDDYNNEFNKIDRRVFTLNNDFVDDVYQYINADINSGRLNVSYRTLLRSFMIDIFCRRFLLVFLVAIMFVISLFVAFISFISS